MAYPNFIYFSGVVVSVRRATISSVQGRDENHLRVMPALSGIVTRCYTVFPALKTFCLLYTLRALTPRDKNLGLYFFSLFHLKIILPSPKSLVI